MMSEPWVSIPFATRPAPVTQQYSNSYYRPVVSSNAQRPQGVRAMAGPGEAQLSNLVDRPDWGKLVARGFRGYQQYYIVLSGWIMNFWDHSTLGIVLTSRPSRPYLPVAWLNMRSARQAYCEQSAVFGVESQWAVNICFQDGIFQFRVLLKEDAEMWVQTIMETIVASGVERMKVSGQSWVPNMRWAGDFFQGPDQEASGAAWLVSRDGRWVEGERHWAPYAVMADGRSAAWGYADEAERPHTKQSEASKLEELAVGGGMAPVCPAGMPALRPVQINLLDQYATGGVDSHRQFHGAGSRTKHLRRIWGDAVRSVAAGRLIDKDSMIGLFALYDRDGDNNLTSVELEAMYTELLNVRRDELRYTLQRENQQRGQNPFHITDSEQHELQQCAAGLSRLYDTRLEPESVLKQVVYIREALDFNHNSVVNVEEFVRMAPHVLFPRDELKDEARFYELCDTDPEAEVDLDGGGCMMQ